MTQRALHAPCGAACISTSFPIVAVMQLLCAVATVATVKLHRMSGFMQCGTLASEAAPGVRERDVLDHNSWSPVALVPVITLHCWREREEHQPSQG